MMWMLQIIIFKKYFLRRVEIILSFINYFTSKTKYDAKALFQNLFKKRDNITPH